MRILVIGASGRFGSHLLPALLARGHDPIAYLRHPSKLDDLLPEDLRNAISIVQGDGEDISALVAALGKYECHGLICCAGSPSSRTGKGPLSRQGYISEAVAHAAEQYARESGVRVRGWWVTGAARLPDPLKKGTVIHDRLPNFRPEHKRTDASVMALPQSKVAWSLLCPSLLKVTSPRVTYPAERRYQDIVQFNAESMRAPWWLWAWIYLWLSIPGCTLLGMIPLIYYTRYPIEAVADALAREFEEQKWVGQVGY